MNFTHLDNFVKNLKRHLLDTQSKTCSPVVLIYHGDEEVESYVDYDLIQYMDEKDSHVIMVADEILNSISFLSSQLKTDESKRYFLDYLASSLIKKTND